MTITDNHNDNLKTIEEMEFKKVKLINNGRLEAVYTDLEGNEVALKGANPVHQDLKNAMKCLVPFLCDITEQKEADKYDWDNPASDENADLLRHLDVKGVTISGSDAFASCVLTGSRTLSVTQKILNLNTPCISLDSDEAEYAHLSELHEAIDAVIEEARLYIRERKYSDAQGTFDFDGDGNADDPFGGDGDAGESGPLKEAV